MSSRNKGDTSELIHRVIDEVIIYVGFCLPALKDGTSEALEHIFQTKALTRQLALAIVLEAGVVTLGHVLHAVKSILSLSSRGRLIRHLLDKQRKAQTQDEWMDLAERIDNIQGDDVWRGDPNCRLYEKDRITARIDEFIHLMRRRDIFELMFVLRGGLARNKFGLLHEGLFSKARGGTKVLVETYHNVVCAALDFVCDSPIEDCVAPIPTEARLAFFNETRHAYGRTALLLSGGGALGMYHAGVVKALLESRLLPRVLGGASAGSIVCGMLGTRTDEECFNDWFEAKGTNAPGHSGSIQLRPIRFVNLPSDDIDPKTDNVVKRAWRATIPRSLRAIMTVVYDVVTFRTPLLEVIKADTADFREMMRTNIGEFTFQEAFDRTGRILNIAVTPMNSSDPPRLLNYLTAPHVLVWSAVIASCSIPGIFGTNRLLVKDADGTVRYETTEAASFGDGSMEQDLPMEQLGEMFNINHFIISQANPHAFMLSSYYHSRSIWANPVMGFLNDVVTFLKNRWRTWIAHFVELVGARRFAPQHSTSRFTLTGIFIQDYQGRHSDISLIPWKNHRSLWSAITHTFSIPDLVEVMEWMQAAERETWKYIPAIRSHIAEEVTLDRCVQRLRNRHLAETQAKKGEPTSSLVGERVSSFLVSPSLPNLGAYNVTDQTRLVEELQPTSPNDDGGDVHGDPPMAVPSTAPLVDESQDNVSEQVAGEESTSKTWEKNNKWQATGGMARFYYRNSASYNDLRRSFSGNSLGDSSRRLHRRQSSSHPDLPVAASSPNW